MFSPFGMSHAKGGLVLWLLLQRTMASSLSSSSSLLLDPLGYTAYDDVSWAVRSNNLSSPVKQVEYNEFMESCREQAGDDSKRLCDDHESARIDMNVRQPQSVRNYTETGYLKIRAPEAVFSLVKEFWEKNKGSQKVEYSHSSAYHNTWDAPPTFVCINNASLIGGGPHLYTAIADATRDAMEAWTGLPQSSTSVYGIRIYHNNSFLTPHVDRLPLVSSAIINVAQDVDEDWYLEVYDHQGVAHNVTMTPGDLVLYESHSIIHGRPFKMRGNFYANIFVHFEPMGLPLGMPDSAMDYDMDLPPYVIAGSAWEEEYRTLFPSGWTLLNNPVSLVGKGDMKTLRYLGQLSSERLDKTDGTSSEWRPIHEAARMGNVEILKFLVEEHNVDVNHLCLVDGGSSPLALAHRYVGADSEASRYLASKGGKIVGPSTSEGEKNAATIDKEEKQEL